MITSYLLFFLIFHHRVYLIKCETVTPDNLDSDEREEVRNAPPDHEIPYSEHEDPPEPVTGRKYEAPGQWARPQADKNIPLEFVPSTTYAQVRGTHTVKRAPRHQALLDASTDEERENAGRLKEVVTDKKVNTIYTEEGYEDAAYNHGGHQRDADFEEDYNKNLENEGISRAVADFRSSSETEVSSEEDGDHPQEASTPNEERLKPKKQKTKKYDPKEAFRKVWAEAEVNPKVIVLKEGLKLERDVERAAEEAALRAETEIPENLKDLASDSRSSENDTGGVSPQTRRTFTGNSKEMYARKGKNLSKNPVVQQPVARALRRYEDSLEAYPTYSDTTPKIYPTYQEIMATTTIHPTTINHGKVFWDYYKTQKPADTPTPSTTDDSSEYQTTEYPSSESDEGIYKRRSGGSHQYSKESDESYETRPTKATRLTPAETSRYSTATAPGAIQALLKSPQVMRAINSPRLNSGESTKIITTGTRADPTTKRPVYTVIIRAPPKQCDEESDESKLQESVSKFELLKHLTNSVNPRSLNSEAMSNISVIKPPALPPFGQVTYADYLRNAYGRSSETQESDSAEESRQVSMETPLPIPPRHYQSPQEIYQPYPQQNYQAPSQKNRLLPFFSWLSLLNPVTKLIPSNRMLPPSPKSRSRYAEYAGKRIGIQLPQKDSRFNVPPYYSPAFQVNGGVIRRFRRQSFGNNGTVFTDERNALTELMDEGVTVKSRGLRIKRSDNDLLYDAPNIVEAVVDREIKARFPDESDVDGNSEKLDNKAEGKVEIDVPDFDFSAALKDIENHGQFDRDNETRNDTENDEKYPFYKDDQIPSNSALKYVINPQQIPRKTLGGMEFYNSRDRYLSCDDVNPDLSGVPPEEEEPKDRGPEENLPRLNGLGDKLSCFKAKYFDKNPLDNPLFMEKRIDTPQVPNEFNLQQFRDRLSVLSSEPEALVYRRVSRKPEMMDQRSSNSKKNYDTNQSRPKYNHNPAPNHRKTKKRYHRKDPIRMITPVTSPYEKEVYEAVMGTIQHQAVHKSVKLKQSSGRPHRRGRKNKVQMKPKAQKPKEHGRPIRPLNYKLRPYRTDKVTYRVRPRVHAGSRRAGYYKAVRVHKRSINSDQDLQVDESKNALGTWTASKMTGTLASKVTTPDNIPRPFEAAQSTPKTVWTIRDLVRFSKPRQIDRYGNFRNGATTVDPRRGEPRYNDPTAVPEESVQVTTSPEEGVVTDTDVLEEDNADLTTANYQVREKIEEQLTEAPDVLKLKEYLESDSPGDKDSVQTNESEEAPTTQYAAESSEEESGEEDKQEESRGEQVEKPSELSTEDSSERLQADEEESQESHSNEEQNVARTSDAEEDFERFSGRPASPAENFYDPEYANLGPRINKPEFYHPPFDPPRYERHRGKNYESLEEEKPKRKVSKYVFPWDEDQEEASKESERKDYQFGHYEFPWEKRERLAREKEKEKIKQNDYYHRYWNDDDQSSSETGFNFEVTHPWNNSPDKTSNFGRQFWSSEIFSVGESKPVKFSNRYHSKRSEAPGVDKGQPKKVKDFMKNHAEGSSRLRYIPTTTVTPQIPPTSVTALPKREPTTPVTRITPEPKIPRYTVRPRPFRPTQTRPSWNSGDLEERATKPNTFRKRTSSTTPNSSTPKSRRRSRTRTTTTRSSTTTAGGPHKYLRSSNHQLPGFDSEESTTAPAKRTVEHRSSVSTEKIITKTSSKSTPKERRRYSSTEDDGLEKSERVQKVSIVTKKTPEHIYRTEKIDKNGVKGMFVSIIPNNSTDDLDIDEDNSMGSSSTSMEDSTHDMDSDIERMDPQVLEDGNIPEHLLASLFMRLPPADLDWIEGSGEVDDNSDIRKSEVTYIKEPDRRLYSYLEDTK